MKIMGLTEWLWSCREVLQTLTTFSVLNKPKEGTASPQQTTHKVLDYTRNIVFMQSHWRTVMKLYVAEPTLVFFAVHDSAYFMANPKMMGTQTFASTLTCYIILLIFVLKLGLRWSPTPLEGHLTWPRPQWCIHLSIGLLNKWLMRKFIPCLVNPL